MVFAASLLAVILGLLSVRVQKMLQRLLPSSSRLLIAAAALAAIFCAAAAWYSALSWQLAAIVFAYVVAPVLLVRVSDAAAILVLWLPLEFAVGAEFVPRPVQGTLHAVAYGIAIILALLIFLTYRRLDGMKYNLPQRAADLRNAALGFTIAALLLIPLGLAVGFLDGPHAPSGPVDRWALRIALIFVGTALPEEILFRSLIQNWLIQRLGASNAVIALAAVIFGLSHLNNAPGPFPNWRYAVVATAAGFIFGKVFQKSTSVVASALVHTGVNTVKHLFF